MKVSSQQLNVRQLFNGRSPISTLKDAADAAFGAEATPIRVAVTGKSRSGHSCEIEAVEPKVYGSDDTEANVFEYRQRRLGSHQRVQRGDVDPDGRGLCDRWSRGRCHAGRSPCSPMCAIS